MVSYKRQGVAEEDEARRVVGQVVGDLVEGLVNCLVIVLADLFGVLIDQVWWFWFDGLSELWSGI